MSFPVPAILNKKEKDSWTRATVGGCWGEGGGIRGLNDNGKNTEKFLKIN